MKKILLLAVLFVSTISFAQNRVDAPLVSSLIVNVSAKVQAHATAATIILPYGVTKQIHLAGKNAANTSERPITNVTLTESLGSFVTVAATGDPLVWNVTNVNSSQSLSGTLNATAKNELNATIFGSVAIQMQPADPAVNIDITE